MFFEQVKEITGSYTITIQKEPNTKPITIDFTPPFKRISMVQAIEEVIILVNELDYQFLSKPLKILIGYWS